MKIVSAHIKNVLSIEEAKINFPDNGLVLVDGWNHDDDTSNGSGKTTIFNAIALCLFGKIPRKITVSKIARNGQKSFSVTCEIHKGEQILKLTRTKSKDFLANLDGKDVNWNQEQLDIFLGMTYEQFLLTIYRAQTEGLQLIKLNDSAKKDFFLQLINMDKFSEKKKEIDLEIKNISSRINQLQIKLEKANTKIETYQESMVDVDELKKELKSIDTSKLKNKLKELSDIDRPDTQKHNEEVSKLRDKLSVAWQGIEKEKAIRNEINQLKNTLNSLEDTIKATLHPVSCPHCAKDFSLHKGKSLTNEDVQAAYKKKKSKIEDQIKSLVDQVNSMPNWSNTKSEIEQEIAIKNNDFNKKSLEYSAIKDQISDIKLKLSRLNDKRDQIESKIQQANEIRDKIAQIKELKHKIESELSIQRDDLKYLTAASEILSPTGAPAYILDSIVESFNSSVSEILTDIWPNSSYQLLTHKENKSGDVKAKLSELFTVNGTQMDIGALSGGELACLSLAIDIAVIEVFDSYMGQMAHIWLIDEPFDGMDVNNRSRSLEVLSRYAKDRSILIVDHASEAKSMFTSDIMVSKRNGISTVEQ